MKENSVIGQRAEQLVAETLRKNGAIISKMNYRSRYGEIDIVAETHKYLIFVEVKLRKKNSKEYEVSINKKIIRILKIKNSCINYHSIKKNNCFTNRAKFTNKKLTGIQNII